MHRRLIPHPDFPTDAITAIEAEVGRPAPGALSLVYRLSGRIADLRIAPKTRPARTDELWRTTCFEAFVHPEPGEAYVEFNLAPSGQWAAYAFTGYRAGMALLEIVPPRLRFRASDTACELHAELAPPRNGRLALTAVIEEMDGRKSYWALAHPEGRPDFHHAAGFTLTPPP
jgi:hypothetical protein